MENLVPKAELPTLSDTEFLAENVTVHGKSCIGCQRWDRDIMISFMDFNKTDEKDRLEYFDLLLTTEQAARLRDRLTEELESNLSKRGVSSGQIKKVPMPNFEKVEVLLKQSYAYKQTEEFKTQCKNRIPD